MNRQDVISAAEAYLEKNWPAMVQDIDAPGLRGMP